MTEKTFTLPNMVNGPYIAWILPRVKSKRKDIFSILRVSCCFHNNISVENELTDDTKIRKDVDFSLFQELVDRLTELSIYPAF